MTKLTEEQVKDFFEAISRSDEESEIKVIDPLTGQIYTLHTNTAMANAIWPSVDEEASGKDVPEAPEAD